MRNVFITGGSGFIGNAVARAFKERGDSVVCLCHTEESKIRLTRQGFSVVAGDMGKPAQWKAQAASAEILVHTAHLRPGIRLSRRWLKSASELRNTGLSTLVDVAKMGGRCEALIYTSGMVVYGDHGNDLINEETPPKRTALGDYHLTGESIVREATKEGIPTFSVRPGLVYGPTGYIWKVFLGSSGER